MTKGTGYGDSYNSYGSGGAASGGYGSYRSNLDSATTKVWNGLVNAYKLYNSNAKAE
jgi:hypothetical protein